jgi:hypothetical protein
MWINSIGEEGVKDLKNGTCSREGKRVSPAN